MGDFVTFNIEQCISIVKCFTGLVFNFNIKCINTAINWYCVSVFLFYCLF